MNQRPFSRCLLLLLMATLLARAQVPNIPVRLDWSGYRGNPIQKTIPLLRADSATTITVVARYGPLSTHLLTPQPVIVNRTLDSLYVQFATTTTLPQKGGWVEVKVGSLVRFAGSLSVNTVPIAPKPSQVAVSYVIIPDGQTVSRINSVSATAAQNAAALVQLVPVSVQTYADAVALATGTLPKRIRVTSESRTYDYWPDSPDPDKLELQVSN